MRESESDSSNPHGTRADSVLIRKGGQDSGAFGALVGLTRVWGCDGWKQNAKSAGPDMPVPVEWENCINALGLSAQQTGIIRLIFQGKKDKQIAVEMGLSKHTVRTYLKRIFDRFDVSDRTALVLHVLSNHRASCPHDECPHK